MAQHFLTSCELFVEMVKSFIGRLARIRVLGAVTASGENMSPMMASARIFFCVLRTSMGHARIEERTQARRVNKYLINCCSLMFNLHIL